MKRFFLTPLVAVSVAMTLACSVEVESPVSEDEILSALDDEDLDEDTLLELGGYETESGSDVEDSAEAEVTSETTEEVDAKLSDEAKANLKKVRDVRKSIREDFRAFCSMDLELKESIREQFKAILSDESLTKEEKKSQAQQVLEANKAAVEADKETFKACTEDNQESFDEMKANHKALAKACLPIPAFRSGKSEEPNAGFKPFVSKERKAKIRSMGPVKKKLMKRKFRRNFDASKLEATLTSETCLAELDKY